VLLRVSYLWCTYGLYATASRSPPSAFFCFVSEEWNIKCARPANQDGHGSYFNVRVTIERMKRITCRRRHACPLHSAALDQGENVHGPDLCYLCVYRLRGTEKHDEQGH